MIVVIVISLLYTHLILCMRIMTVHCMISYFITFYALYFMYRTNNNIDFRRHFGMTDYPFLYIYKLL